MAQDVVGCRDEEEEVRQGEVLQIGGALHFPRVAAGRPDNVLVLGALDLRPFQGLDEGERVLDALLGLGEAGVVDGREFRPRDAGKTTRRIAAEIRRLTDLPGQAEHVRIQPVGQQRRFLDLVGRAMGGSLVDDVGQGAELLRADRHGCVVHGECHGVSFSRWGQAAQCVRMNRRTRSIVRSFSSGGVFQGKTVISAFGASEATSIEVCNGCPGVSSGITSIGVWQERTKSRGTLYTKSGWTRKRLWRYASMVSMFRSGRRASSSGAQLLRPPLYMWSGSSGRCPTGWQKTAATTRSGARCISFPAKQLPMQ